MAPRHSGQRGARPISDADGAVVVSMRDDEDIACVEPKPVTEKGLGVVRYSSWQTRHTQTYCPNYLADPDFQVERHSARDGVSDGAVGDGPVDNFTQLGWRAGNSRGRRRGRGRGDDADDDAGAQWAG